MRVYGAKRSDDYDVTIVLKEEPESARDSRFGQFLYFDLVPMPFHCLEFLLIVLQLNDILASMSTGGKPTFWKPNTVDYAGFSERNLLITQEF